MSAMTDEGAMAAEDGEVRDELPDDLNASEFVGPYVFPNNNRRRIAASLYVLLGLGFVALWLLVGEGFARRRSR